MVFSRHVESHDDDGQYDCDPEIDDAWIIFQSEKVAEALKMMLTRYLQYARSREELSGMRHCDQPIQSHAPGFQMTNTVPSVMER